MKDLAIIMPAYNAGNHIERTIDILLSQKKDVKLDYHIFIYDDASTDNTAKVLQKYKSNNMVEVIYLNENKPTGDLRNLGIQIAYERGYRYVAFLDSDDYYIMSTIEEIINTISDSSCVIGIGLYDNVDYKTGEKLVGKDVDGFYGIKIPEDKILNSGFSMFGCTNAGSCNKVYNLNFLIENNITFASTYYGEDMAFVYKALNIAGYDRISMHHKIMHRYSHWSTNPNSNDRKSVERPNDIFVALDNVWDYFESKQWENTVKNKHRIEEDFLIAAIGHIEYAAGKLADKDGDIIRAKGLRWLADKKKLVDKYNIIEETTTKERES